jgi:excinuclease ABC subunit C
MNEALRQKLERLPTEPGVYLMKDRAGAVVYVGKAVNLRSRVRSYFTRATSGPSSRSSTTCSTTSRSRRHSEKEALLLESELIKKHKPRFNVMLRDDKSFICLQLDG